MSLFHLTLWIDTCSHVLKIVADLLNNPQYWSVIVKINVSIGRVDMFHVDCLTENSI